MKNYIITSFLLIVFQFSTVLAQDNKHRKPEGSVPILVEQTFKSKFPNKDAVWFSQYQGRYNDKLVYEARFMFDNRYSAAIFNKEANLIAFTATITAAEIPQKAVDYMKEHYPYQSVTEAGIVDRGNKSTVELGIYINGRFTVVVFNKEGNFIKATLG